MYAIVRTGGKQYKVAKDDVIAVEKIAVDPGQPVLLEDVLALGGHGSITLGSPFVAGAVVTAEVSEQVRADKIIVFKKKRRKNYRRKHGHRQCLTMLRIIDIKAEGKAGSPNSVPQETPVAKQAASEKSTPSEKSAQKPVSQKSVPPVDDSIPAAQAADPTGAEGKDHQEAAQETRPDKE